MNIIATLVLSPEIASYRLPDPNPDFNFIGTGAAQMIWNGIFALAIFAGLISFTIGAVLVAAPAFRGTDRQEQGKRTLIGTLIGFFLLGGATAIVSMVLGLPTFGIGGR